MSTRSTILAQRFAAAACFLWTTTVPAPRAAAQAKSADGAVTVYHWWTSGSELAAVNALVAVVKAQHPNLKVNPRATGAHGGGGRMFQLVSQAAAPGRPSQVFQIHAGGQARPYFEAGLLAPVDEVWAHSGLEQAVPAMVRQMSRIDGHYYLLPIDVHRNNLVWYNKVVLDKHGVDPAALTTWEGFFKAAEKLKAAGLAPVVQVGETWTLGVAFESMMAGLGIGAYEDWINGKITAPEDPRPLEALNVFKRYLSYANRDHAGTAWDAAIQRLVRGESAFCIMGDWANGEFQQAGLKYGRDYGAFLVPGTKGMYGVTVDAFAHTRGPAPDSSRWMSAAASREGQDAFNTAKGSIPARTDADVVRYDAYQRSAIADFKAARHIYPNLTSATHDAFENGVEETLKRFAADLDVKKAAAALAEVAARSRTNFRQEWSLQ
jgi:glucose/mannose transport system substrate-binding protein